jgi:hypothetical protein
MIGRGSGSREHTMVEPSRPTFASEQMGNRMNAIAVLTRTPQPELLEFYARFVRLGYDVFAVVDDNNFKAEQAEIYSIQIDDTECRGKGYFNLNPIIKKESGCSAWDKALYYFCLIDTSHDNVWFIEDDVFVPLPETIYKMDQKYGKADIISKENSVNELGVLIDWFWWKCVPKKRLPPPWAKSMVCAVRLSRRLLKVLALFIQANKHKLRFTNIAIKFANFLTQRKEDFPRKFYFVEYIFHTLALNNQLSVVIAKELCGIQWRKQWDVSEMDVETLYHPVKDANLHGYFRKILAGNNYEPESQESKKSQ